MYTNAIEAGNKVLANTGLIQMYGLPRSYRSRLMQTVMPNDKQIVVSPGLDWTTNDTIGLAPTTINWFEADYAVIVAYNNVTGVVTLDRPMSNYHFGA